MHFLIAVVVASTALFPVDAQRTPAKPRRPAAQQRTQAPPQPSIEEVIAVQVALTREGFSTGVIDGRMGVNTTRALDAYRKQRASDPAPSPEPLVAYQITDEDAAGPFEPEIPTDLMEQSKLPALSYRSVAELLAERFHTTPEILKKLNPDAAMNAGTSIRVPNVDAFMLPSTSASKPAQAASTSKPQQGRAVGTTGRAAAASTPALDPVVITVSRSGSSLTVTSQDGRILYFAPVTTGSEHDPLPLGDWNVTGVYYNPPFRYNPDLFWDANPSHSKATIPRGPNGPIGVVWIDLTKEHYGIHGAPEPSQIGRTQSHGCVRLTNWDAVKVAGMVGPGTPVRFVE